MCSVLSPGHLAINMRWKFGTGIFADIFPAEIPRISIGLMIIYYDHAQPHMGCQRWIRKPWSTEGID